MADGDGDGDGVGVGGEGVGVGCCVGLGVGVGGRGVLVDVGVGAGEAVAVGVGVQGGGDCVPVGRGDGVIVGGACVGGCVGGAVALPCAARFDIVLASPSGATGALPPEHPANHTSVAAEPKAATNFRSERSGTVHPPTSRSPRNMAFAGLVPAQK